MATYRQVYLSFWNDGTILDFTPEEKYFYLYLITNSKTNQCGIYELPKTVIAFETRLTQKKINSLLLRLEKLKKIKFSEKTSEICVCNFLKYNYNDSPNSRKGVRNELNRVKDKTLIECLVGYTYFMEEIEENWETYLSKLVDFEGALKPLESPSQAPDKGILQNRTETEQNRNITETDTESPLPGNTPPAITLTYDGDGQCPITKDQIDEWQKNYPIVDVPYQLKRIQKWLIGKPYRCRSIPEVQSFITDWLEREVNIRGSTDGRNSKNPDPEPGEPPGKLGIHL